MESSGKWNRIDSDLRESCGIHNTGPEFPPDFIVPHNVKRDPRFVLANVMQAMESDCFKVVFFIILKNHILNVCNLDGERIPESRC